jgi:flagellar hook-length control protein FliK
VAAETLKLDVQTLQWPVLVEPLADATPGEAGAGLGQVSGEPLRPHSAATGPANVWSSSASQRMEQYEELAQRLGEALGQRLQSQLERGQWKVQMRLDPAQLGRIDLDLDMNAGSLEAVFRSDNQVTRDLIAQSLPKLRDSLAQAGTAVANVWVQGDSSRQSGGNPTPERAPEMHQDRSRDTDSEEPAAAAASPRPRRGTSAWDVLA